MGKPQLLDRQKHRLDGYTVLITGASAGIGKETARDLALRGAKVVMANRNLEKSAGVIEALRKEEGEEALPDDRIVVRQIDMANLDSVKSFCEKVKIEFPEIDILINNAGYSNFQDPRKETGDGLEIHFQTNHLGGFLMTHLLIDNVLASTKKPRVIFVSSNGYKGATDLDFDDLEQTKEGVYKGSRGYGISKLANLLTARKLARKYSDGLRVYAIHPGFVKTEIARHMDNAFFKFVGFVLSPFMTDEKRGAYTSIHCAISPEVENQSGLYYDSKGNTQDVDIKLVNEENEEKMWSKTCEILQITW